MPTFRSRVGSVTRHYPALHSILKSIYRSLPIALRGEKLVYDHFRRHVVPRGPQRFVLIGANDGVFNDHVYDFARTYGWKGAAVEPNPMFHSILQQNYRGMNVTVINKAVHRTERSMPLYYLQNTDGLPDWMQGIGSFDREQVLASADGFADVEDRIGSIDVPCAPLSEIIAESGLDNVDILVIDVEGYDAEIVRQIDFDRYAPHTIIFEYRHLHEADLADVRSLLSERGYRMRTDEEDLLATTLEA